ncbi:MAG TPA: 4Fe-4S binding protein [Anaerovoracaceae bacterium]|nr:4Fe-4S binding protein [Anaerovoracaceae bacterium]
MDFYKELQQRLDAHPAGAPPSPLFDRILRMLFTPEEAEIACSLTFLLQPLNKIAQKMGMDEAPLKEILERMADKGVIMARPTKEGLARYSLLATIPGLFEIPFMRPDRTPNKEKLSKLWHDYHTESFGDAFSGSPTPQVRVVPVQSTIPSTTEILYYEQVSELIKTANFIALTDCACRNALGLCDKPKEVCLLFDQVGEFLVERGFGRRIDQEEALKVLNLAEEAGLVHCTDNAKGGRRTVICNCCGCCCTILRGITVCHNPHAVAHSAYVIEFSPDECIGCFSCLDSRCQVSAIQEDGDIIAVDVERCIGCGLCASVCTTGALSMKLRAELPAIPEEPRDLLMTALNEKGKTEAFMKINQE